MDRVVPWSGVALHPPEQDGSVSVPGADDAAHPFHAALVSDAAMQDALHDLHSRELISGRRHGEPMGIN